VTCRLYADATPVAGRAVLERTDRLAVIAGRFPWDDIGSWDALRRVRPRDA
jgi:mannose-1-phosphate guanylyltransferase